MVDPTPSTPPQEGSNLQADDDSYSIIEQLADAMRLEDDVQVSPEDRAMYVRDYFEGPRQCQCCINWVDEVPADVDLDANDKDEDDGHPLILRRRILPGESQKKQASVHSVEIRNAEVREVLFEVFEGLDGLHPDVKYLIFLAPFCQFFWRWEAFEKAVAAQKNEKVQAILMQLRAIVKRELADAFAVSKELTSNGVITFKYLWTLFRPSELIYSDMFGPERFTILQSSRMNPPRRHGNASYSLHCRFVDWDGYHFGYSSWSSAIWHFRGTRKITDLPAYPAKYMTEKDREAAVTICIERGKKMRDLAGIQYKSYHSTDRGSRRVATRPSAVIDGDSDAESVLAAASADGKDAKVLDRRIVLDAKGHPSRFHADELVDPAKLPYTTGIITQTPVDAAPPGGHVPLERPPGPQGRLPSYPHRPPGRYPGHIDYDESDFDDGMRMQRQRHPVRRPLGAPPGPHAARPVGQPRRRASTDSLSSLASADSEDEGEKKMSDLQLQLCASHMLGYCLKEKKWRSFLIDRIEDVKWNTAPFESLVLPDGYKDLILSFVESQLKDGDAFDDVINGKGGGLVILLAGDPGVGKTLTAESVAEKINAPLYKMELGQLIDDDDPEGEDSRRRNEDDIVTAFDLAAKWKAVLLIDECDLYLEKRSDLSPKRNRMVSRFLQELEYYPSLLFLTTNREKALDPGIYSRIHLTINYPALDTPSRRTIWKTFLDRENSNVGDAELDKLADLDVNGRRIRNLTKTARIMAKRAGRPICFDDIKQVMRITEGVVI